jgi:RNA polymerase sigma-70 factor (ECF subfamily)
MSKANAQDGTIDARLIDLAKHGDREALARLLEEISPLVHRFGLRMCQNQADAEDVLQDTLLSVADHLPAFEGRASLASWVFMIARTACARRRRGSKNRPHLPEEAVRETASEGSTPEEALDQSELRTGLDRALASLSDEHREMLLLRDVEGLTAAEVAETLALSVAAVKSRLHRARAALRVAWDSALRAQGPLANTDCPNVVLALSKKLEGDLAAEDCATMEKHLEICPGCAEACSALRAALGACRREGNGEVSANLRARIHSLVDELVVARR